MSDANYTELITPADATVARTSETALSYNLVYNNSTFDLARSAYGDGLATTGITAAGNMLWNGATFDRQVSVVAGLNSTGTGIPASALVGQLDDTATTSVTENQFAVARISTRRALLIEGVASGTAVGIGQTTAAALSDSTSNPTVAGLAAFGMAWDNTQWVRVRAWGASGDSLGVPGSGIWTTSYNYLYNAVTTLWDRPRTAESFQGNASSPLPTGLMGTAIGPGFARRVNPSNLGTAVNSASTQNVDGSNVLGIQIGTATTGTFTFEVTNDGTTWLAATVWDDTNEAWVSGTNLTPAVGVSYLLMVDGYRQVRIRTVSTLGAAVAHVMTFALGGAARLVGMSNGGAYMQGAIANDAPDSGNPVKIGGLASTTAPAAVTSLDRVNAWFQLNGSLMTGLTDSTGVKLQLGSGVSDGTNHQTTTLVPTYSLLMGQRSATASDVIRTIESLDAAPTSDRGVLAIGAGPGWDRKSNPAGVAANSTSNAVTIVTDGADMMAFHVTTIGTTPGSMIFQTSNDDAAWATAGYVIKLGSGPDTRIEGSFVPAVDDVYLVRTTGARQVRYKVNAAYASGTATVKVTGSMGVGMVKGSDMAPPSHNIGYAILSATAQYTTTQTSTTLGPTVSSTQRAVVIAIQIQAGGTTAGELQVYFGTGAYSRGTNKALFDGEFAPSATLKPGFAMAYPTGLIGAADEEVKVTDSAAINKLTVTIWYYLVTA